MKVKSYALFIAPLVVGATLGWIDTSDYRAALSDLGDNLSHTAIEIQAQRLSNDFGRTGRCRPTENNAKGLIRDTPEGRACMITAMEQIETVGGALEVLSTAASWLKYHPSDDAFRAAAVDSINLARSKLAAELPTLNRLAKVQEAHDRSKVMRLLDGRTDSSNQFAFMANQLDRIEYELLLPSVAQKQRDWLLKTVLANQSTPNSLSPL